MKTDKQSRDNQQHHKLFKNRLRRLNMRGAITTEAIHDAMHLSPTDYTKKHRARRTIIQLGDTEIDLLNYYQSANRETPYNLFRRRTLSLQKRNRLNDETLSQACSLSYKEWTYLYGGGRRRSVTYKGSTNSQLKSISFPSIASLLRSIKRDNDKALIWNRLKNAWKLEDALTIPYNRQRSCNGTIYAAIRIKTSEIYVGLTTMTADMRWSFHIRKAKDGHNNKLSRAIREDGDSGFIILTLESGIKNTEELSLREILWSQKLQAHGPTGLNSAKAGGLGSPRGKTISYNDREFPSLAEAIRTMSIETNLPPHAIGSRVKSNTPLPSSIRRHSKHPAAGSNLFRRWLALIRRHPDMVCAEWKSSFDTFCRDISPFQPNSRMIRTNPTKPWSAENFTWMTTKEAAAHIHGKPLTAFGKSFNSHTELAEAYGISVSTLKNRIFKQRLSYEEAVTRIVR
ncbi:GIY-YIG nuclease family protein [Pseudomonas aeruginosa]